MACLAMNNTPGAILAALLAFDTTSRHSNLAMIDWIADFLAARGVASRRFYDPSGGKANLYARLGPSGGGGVMLSGHTDVVPVDGQAWSVPPFSLTERDGRYYGRGSADMKGFLACVLAAVDDFLAAPLRMPLHLAFSYGRLSRRAQPGGFSAGLAGETGAVPHRRADRDAAGVRS